MKTLNRVYKKLGKIVEVKHGGRGWRERSY
jgi:hypothetical protein